MNSRNHLNIVLVGLIALVGGSCDLMTGLGGGEPVLGTVEIVAPADAAVAGDGLAADAYEEGAVTILAPDTVTAGEPFQVTVVTWGEHGCWTAHHTEVEASPLRVHLRPYDYDEKRVSGDQACPASMTSIEHTEDISFGEPGEGLLSVTGVRAVGGDVEQAVTRTYDVPIVLRSQSYRDHGKDALHRKGSGLPVEGSAEPFFHRVCVRRCSSAPSIWV